MHHFAAVQEWRRDGIQRVGRANEQHLTQINWNVQVVVSECMILFGVQDLQQCGRWISVKVVVANFVDLVAMRG